ncbi:MAG: hypothetical protein AABY15_02230 [Nanoarchaeota archaeon]
MSREITKLFRPYNGEQLAMAQVYDNSYTSNMKKMNELADILKKDFGVLDHQIDVHKFGGQRVKDIPFVEVQLGKMIEVPEGYTKVEDIEYVL